MAEALRWGKPMGRQKKMLIFDEAGRTVSTVPLLQRCRTIRRLAELWRGLTSVFVTGSDAGRYHTRQGQEAGVYWHHSDNLAGAAFSAAHGVSTEDIAG
jgi:hypothetical protein